jgi:ribose 5-phosphate isomerase
MVVGLGTGSTAAFAVERVGIIIYYFIHNNHNNHNNLIHY